jgi:hypothetical protein
VPFWTEISSTNDAANSWVAQVRRATAFIAQGKIYDMIVEAYLAPPAKALAEINLQRFVAENGTVGIWGHPFAQRIATPGRRVDGSTCVGSRNALFVALRNLNLEPHNERK